MTGLAIDPRVIYSPAYDITLLGLERLHPFDGRKYTRAWQATRRAYPAELERRTLRPPHPIEHAKLLAVHTPEYLARLRSPAYVAQVMELPILARLPMPIVERQVLRPMRLATMGTLMAARAALRGGLAVNLAGGYHHASRERGEGFCVYADVSIAIAALRAEAALVAGQDVVLIVDLDAHQGNGHERVAAGDEQVYILDIYNGDIYPQDWTARRRINCDRPLPSNADDARYLPLLKEALGLAVREAGQPRLAFYIAGSDVHEHDLLGGLGLSTAGILARDQFVLNSLAQAGIPTVMLTAGGYGRDSYLHISASLNYILATWGDSSPSK